MEVKIIPVQARPQVEEVALLAKQVWNEHYTPLIGKQQVDYMVEKFQSVKAISCAIEEEGYLYYLLQVDGCGAGYLGIQPDTQAKQLFLSKFYILDSFRGQGIGTAAMEYLLHYCKEHSLVKIWLTCNKGNSGSLAAYEHLGFSVVSTQVADIGNGYAMDDYILERQL